MKITGFCPRCMRPYPDCKCASWNKYKEKKT